MRKLLAVPFLTVSLFLATFVGTSAASGSSSQPPVKIACLCDLTGSYAAYGPAEVNGLKIAINDINAAGGVLGGRKLELKVYDGQTDPSTYITLFNQIVSSKSADFIVGGICPSCATAVAPTLTRDSELLFNDLSQEPAFNAGVKWMFYSFPPSGASVPTLLAYLKNKGITKVGIVVENDPSEITDTQVVQKDASHYGIKVVANQEYNGATIADFSSILLQEKSAGAQALMLAGAGTDYTLLPKNAENMGWNVPLLAVDGDIVPATTTKEVGASEASHFTWGALPIEYYQGLAANSPTKKQFAPEMAQYVKGWTACGSVCANASIGVGGQQWDLMHLLALAINKAGSTDETAVRDALYKVHFEGVYGNYTFTATNHGPTGQFKVATVSNNQVKLVNP